PSTPRWWRTCWPPSGICSRAGRARRPKTGGRRRSHDALGVSVIRPGAGRARPGCVCPRHGRPDSGRQDRRSLEPPGRARRLGEQGPAVPGVLFATDDPRRHDRPWTVPVPWLSPRNFAVEGFRSTFDYVFFLIAALFVYLQGVIIWSQLHGP